MSVVCRNGQSDHLARTSHPSLTTPLLLQYRTGETAPHEWRYLECVKFNYLCRGDGSIHAPIALQDRQRSPEKSPD